MDDQRIIELCFRRDEQAIRETDGKYGRLCRSIAYNILGNHEDAEECVNDAYMGMWNAIPPARPDSLTAYICRITRNLSLKRLEFLTREKRSRAVLVSLEELEEVLPDERCDPSVGGEEIGRRIGDFLRGEKESVRDVFIRKYYFFDSVGDIARRYSFTESKVKNMLYRTRNKLRDYLIKEGVEL